MEQFLDKKEVNILQDTLNWEGERYAQMEAFLLIFNQHNRRKVKSQQYFTLKEKIQKIESP